MNKKNRSFMKWTALLSVMMLVGCQQTEDLQSSVESRWLAIIEQDFESAYEYFSPGHKETETAEAFSLRMLTAQMNMKWTKGEFVSANCVEETICEVKIKLDYEYSFSKRSLGGVAVNTEVSENWIQVEGKWYFVPKGE